MESHIENDRPAVAMPSDLARLLLERAAPLVRLPTSPDPPPELLPDGSGLRCLATNRIYPCREDVLDLLGFGPAKRVAQHILDTPFTARMSDC